MNFSSWQDALASNLNSNQNSVMSTKSNCDCGAEPTMARYGIEENLSGTVSPVIFDKEFFNFNIMFNAGIFIIMDPGYYRFTIQCFHNQTRDKYATMHAYVNSGQFSNRLLEL